MTEVDFGKLVARVLGCMDYAESDLVGDERHGSRKALERYKQALVEEIRQVFDEAEAPAPVPPTCSNCGMVLEERARFCTRCGRPLPPATADEILTALLAREVNRSPGDPRLQEQIASLRDEAPEQWDALVQKISAMAKAP